MQVIPVIDIRGGLAVAAVRGDRARYRPLESPLVPSAEPVAVAEALQALFPFDGLYVADLEGIEGRGADRATQRRLAHAWSGRELWIDDGRVGAGADAEKTSPPTLTLPMMKSHVLGSESLASRDDYIRARETAGADAPLSLDFRGDAFLGPPELLDDVALWPKRVIVMTLARVGSGEGPDLARLSAIVARAEGRQVYAAGGVRHAGDLEVLRDLGVAGALVATALHAGRITRADLDALAART